VSVPLLLAVLLYAGTLFVSAFLLFLIQPMIAQMILPLLGGTPAVWNTCMVFFQAALLAGYGYTHSATTYLPARRQTVLQGILLLLPFAFFLLPFGIGSWTPPADSNPIFSVLIILLMTVGLPFFVVATSAPLLQRWFASTGHPAAKDPYFLYGASNLGSMIALISYPFFFQRFFELGDLTKVWTIGYAVLIGLVGLCALTVWLAPKPVQLVGAGTAPSGSAMPASVAPEREKVAIRAGTRARSRPIQVASRVAAETDLGERLTWKRRLRWVALAAAPSSLMLGVTTYLTTDIAAVPLLWILPLALYLVSFIFVFARWPVPWTGTPHRITVYLQPLVLLVLGMVVFYPWSISTWQMMLAHLTAFFICVMVCHGELAKDRPPARQLTEFYLWMSVGGVVGGIFNCLIAPLIFKHVIEYPVVLMLVLFLRPQTHFWSWIRRKPEPEDDHGLQEYLLDIGWAGCLGMLSFALLKLGDSKFWNGETFTRFMWDQYARIFNMNDTEGQRTALSWAKMTYMLVIEGIPVGICLCLSGRPVRLGLAVFCLFFANYWIMIRGQATPWYEVLFGKDQSTVYENRSFFGVQRIREDDNANGKYYVLIHGGIDHGRQNRDPEKRDRPISYFWPTNPIGQVFTQMQKLGNDPPYAVVGLGIGTLASYSHSGQEVDFYEIDPAVKELSLPSDGSEPYFYYLQDALKRGTKLQVILGDGRLRIKDAPKDHYQVIVLDAFSSDAIPVHLMTVEAVKLYLEKLKQDGILVFNITNRYVRLGPVLQDVAKQLNLVCLQQGDFHDDNDPDHFGSDWVILFREKDNKVASAEAAAFVGALQPGMLSGVPWAGIFGAHKIDWPAGLPQRLVRAKWEVPAATGRPAWTDSYQDLVRAMAW
jgi:hypothetical protein